MEITEGGVALDGVDTGMETIKRESFSLSFFLPFFVSSTHSS